MAALSRHFDVALDPRGNVMGSATVTVTRWDGAAVTIYQDRNGTIPYIGATLIADPFGNYGFYGSPGYYKITISKIAYLTIVRDDVLLPLVDAKLTPDYFGITEGAVNQDITAGLQAWVYEIIQHVGPGVVASGRLRSGLIELPDGQFVIDSIIWHPALSLYGSNRAGTKLRMRDNASPVGPDAVPAMFYLLARTQEVQATGAWTPAFKHLRLSGNKGNQSNQFCYGIYCEKGENDPHFEDYLAGGTELKSYSAIHAENTEIEGFSGDGIRANGDRQRLMLFGRTRSINHGIMVGDTVVTDANGVHILGNDPVISDCGFGGCTGHSVSAAGCSGVLMHGNNVWGTTSAARSNGALALHVQNCNGFNIVGNTFNDTCSFYGGESNEDRSSAFVGNHIKPNKAVFSADGVPVGAVTNDNNAFLRIRGYKNVVIGLNDYSSDSLGRRYEYLASFTDAATGFIHFAASTQTDVLIKPWHTSQAIPLYVSGDSKASVLMHDPYRDMHRFSGQVVIDMNQNNEPDPAYSLIHAGSKPVLLGNRVHRERGDSLIPAKAQAFESPASGDTYTVANSRARVTFYSSNQLATFTAVLPGAVGNEADDGHELELVFVNGVRDFTLAMGDPVNQSLFGDPVDRIPPGTTLKLTFKRAVAPAGQWWVTSTRNDGRTPHAATQVNMTNGGSLNMDGANLHAHLTRSSTCTGFNVNLPAEPVPSEIRRITVHRDVTAWTMTPAAGHTLSPDDTWPPSIPAGGGYTIEVQFLNNVWYLVRAG